MNRNIWGRKIGMTQVYSGDAVVPVTAVDVGSWIVTGIKTTERDGYNAIQVACLRERYKDKPFQQEWLKEQATYFSKCGEITADESVAAQFVIGQPAAFTSLVAEGDVVDVTGATIGHGFTGVVKRYDFRGPSASHGSKMGKTPGSLGFMRSQGKVIKGKRLPGHMGIEQQTMKNLKVVKILADQNVILIKGSVPGKIGSLVSVRKV